jgi:hypothetical protein
MLRLLFGFLIVILTARPSAAFDHTYALLQDSVLKPFVSAQGVDYAGLRVRISPLDRFLDQCAQVTFAEYQHFTRSEQMAFLINLYNAATLKLVCNHWPIAGIRDVGGVLSSPWTKPFIHLFRRTVGLGQIQHDILRPEFREPRIHFALCMAAQSSPRLRSEPYLPARIDEQLETQTAEFMTARPEINRFEKGALYLSPIFRWYSPDFGKQAGLRAFVRKYFPDVTPQTKIEYTEFDWSLNRKP